MMARYQFETEAIPYLLALFPSLKPLLHTEAQIDLWYQELGSVDLERFMRGVEQYAAEYDRRPTVKALRAYLPVTGGSEKCTHEWDDILDTNGEVLRRTCIRCAVCGPGCRCRMCVCTHPHAELYPGKACANGVWWYWCPDCEHVLLRRYPLGQQE